VDRNVKTVKQAGLHDNRVDGYRGVALALSGISAFFVMRAGMDTGNWLGYSPGGGSRFYHFAAPVIIAQRLAIDCNGILATLRARIGWSATYKHGLIIFTILFLLPAQFMPFQFPSASQVEM
jgi:hypothetical protein